MFVKWSYWLNAIVLFILSVLWLSSYHFHHSLGFDHEQVISSQVKFRYERMWWPGNGSLLIGQGVSWQPIKTHKHYASFDLAADFFHAPYKQPSIKTTWNRFGFWWVHETNQHWLGIPAGLPVLVSIALGHWLRLTIARRVKLNSIDSHN